ncbi:energy transducer TonB [Pseudoduganella aquatica]|uniref:TonB family protein n=1 Tax=Pseudoduganella aquatica TaxID=2660641 RepID=A0A7X4KLX0_9BURK|nr:energy transducer TonB [Pseudoduganella aquatica]MYN07483.1 TonB family protein [Pseudoduganella aquatica]
MKNEKNLTGITVVAALHVALAVLVMSSSRITVFHLPETTVDLVKEVVEPPRKVEYTDLPMDAPRQPDIYVPPVPDHIPQQQSNVTARPLTDSAQPSTPGPVVASADTGAARVAPTRAPVHVAAVVDAANCAKPDYPKSALRNGDSGAVTLALLIGTDGRVADSKIVKSSGFRDLDRAAQVGLGLCRFKPGTIDGVPQQSWTRMQYVWNLDD